MSERPGGGLLAPIGDYIRRILSRPTSPAPSESRQASSSHNLSLMTEHYGLFTFGEKRPPGNYNIELSIPLSYASRDPSERLADKHLTSLVLLPFMDLVGIGRGHGQMKMASSGFETFSHPSCQMPG